jgi:FAD/FMN-containing dehydrogenase
MNLDAALDEWSALLGPPHVLRADQAAARYAQNTLGIVVRVAAAVRPASTEQVARAFAVARKHRVPVYPVSRGRNWGYGCAVPTRPGCAVFDLGRMDKVLELDPDADTVTLQPGVTQGMLSAHFAGLRLPYMVPTTGAGPDASILGNALDRGYGLTPHADHFLAITSLEAVLADGSVYRSPLCEAECPEAAKVFKWGVGPYLDGLFAQSGMGIVTAATIRLARRPEQVTAFVFRVPHDSQLEQAVSAVRGVQRACGGVVSGVNLMSGLRMLAMSGRYVVPDGDPGGGPSALAGSGLPAWTGLGAVYGAAPLARAACGVIRRILRHHGFGTTLLTERRVAAELRLLRLVPGAWAARRAGRLARFGDFLRILRGEPNAAPLNLAYCKAGLTEGAVRNPTFDGVGLIWYSPLVPMRPESVREYAGLARRVCQKHRRSPAITFSSVADGCFDSALPNLFSKGDARDAEQARECHSDLFSEGQSRGFFPYRLGVDQMSRLGPPSATCWRLAAALKAALDPDELLAPGRYGLRPDSAPIAQQ